MINAKMVFVINKLQCIKNEYHEKDDPIFGCGFDFGLYGL
jgi:hypothetical protein